MTAQTKILRSPHDRDRFIESLMEAPLPLSVEWEPYRKKRSTGMNALYWASIVTPLAEHCGYSPNEMHDELLGAYFGWEEKEFNGHKREVPRRRTTFPKTISWEEMADYIEHCRSIAANMGVVIPIREAG